MNKLTEWLTKPFLDENVDLPINIGDTIKMGKFKNKKVVVKKIDWNEKGDLLINGRPALKFRMPSGDKVLLPKPPEIKVNPYDDEQGYNIRIEFTVNNIEESTQTVEILLERLR